MELTWSVSERTRLAMRGERLTSHSSSLGRAEGGLLGQPAPEMFKEDACSVIFSTQPCCPCGPLRWGGGEPRGGSLVMVSLRGFSKYFLMPSSRILSLFTTLPSLWRGSGEKGEENDWRGEEGGGGGVSSMFYQHLARSIVCLHSTYSVSATNWSKKPDRAPPRRYTTNHTHIATTIQHKRLKNMATEKYFQMQAAFVEANQPPP